MSPGEVPGLGPHLVEADRGHVPAAGDLAGGVERGGGGAEHDGAPVVLRRVAQVLEQPGDLADAEQEHAGGVGVEGAGVADLAGAEVAAGLGHHVVAGPARGLVDDDEAVGTRRPRAAAAHPVARARARARGRAAARGQPAEEVLDPAGAADDVVGPEHQLGRALHPGLVADGRAQAGRASARASSTSSSSSTPPRLS